MGYPGLCFGLAVLLMPSVGSAQVIRGVVVHDSTDTPIAGVTIELRTDESTILATTVAGATGWFQLDPGSAGTFLLRTSHPVYTVDGSLTVAVEEREIVTVVLRMSGGAVALEPLLVTARSFDRLSGFRERATQGGLGRYITRADIDKGQAILITGILHFVSEVRVEPVRNGGLTGTALLMNSFGSWCRPAIFLDGMPVPSGDFGFDINDLLSPDMVEGVEIYRSYAMAPAEFQGAIHDCGVIAFWSRTVPGGRRFTWKRLGIGGLIAALVLLAR